MMSYLQAWAVFIAVAEEKSFSSAAKKLSLSQPTVSFHIDALEKELAVLGIQKEALEQESLRTSHDSESKEKEAYLKIISGEEDISYFDTFVKEWNEQGGQTITSEVSESMK